MPVEIPQVDFTSYKVDEVSEETVSIKDIRDLANKLDHAFRTVGFVYISNHGITQKQIDDVLCESDKFFKLPVESKQKYTRPKDLNNGWVSLERENLNPERPAADLKEAFNITLLCEGDFWPDDEVPGFRKEVTCFWERCKTLSKRILQLMAIGLKLEDADYFAKCHTESSSNGTTLRSLYYPSLDGLNIKPGQVRCGEHSDYGTITLLFQDMIGGLEVQMRNGEYLPATPVPGTILVNIGDLMQRWTSDALLAAKHRVLIPEDESVKVQNRHALAYFVHPDDDTLITCFDGSNKYPPITAGDYLKMRFGVTY